MNIKRINLIVNTLIKNKQTTLNQLSLICDVSVKTIQNDIADFNDEMQRKKFKTRIISKSRVGIKFEMYSPEEIEELFMADEELLSHSNNRNEKLEISFDLLRNKYTKIEDLTQNYLLSRSKVSEYIQEIKEEFSKYDIHLKNKPHYGLQILGDENKIREYVYRKLVLLDYAVQKDLLKVNDGEFTELNERIVVLIKNYKLSMADEVIEQLFLYVHIMAIRLRKKCSIGIVDIEIDKNSIEYTFANKVVKEISVFFDKSIPDTEIAWIYKFILGKISVEKIESNSIELQKVADLVEQILRIIKIKYRFDFSDDITLYTSLVLHLSVLIKRAKTNEYSINPVKDEIKRGYPLPYDMAVETALYLNKVLRTELNEDEISYIAVYLHLALERSKRKSVYKKNVLVVCPAGRGMSQLMAYNIQQQFGKFVSITKTCGYYELDGINFDEFDYIFTCKPLNMNLPVPVIELPLMFTQSEVETALLKMTGKSEYQTPLMKLTPQELFFGTIDAVDRNDALIQIVHKIKNIVEIKPNFLEAIYARETTFATELDNYFAFPHPLYGDVAEKSFLSVTILNKPIVWKEKKVQIILLGFIKTGESIDLQHFYRSFARLVSNMKYAIRLIEKPTYVNFVEISKEL